MAFLSQALHLGSLLLPHNAFQEHAAHRAEWSAQLSSKDSERTCIRSGRATFLQYAFTAHTDLVVKYQAVDVVEVISSPIWRRNIIHTSCRNRKWRCEALSPSQ